MNPMRSEAVAGLIVAALYFVTASFVAGSAAAGDGFADDLGFMKKHTQIVLLKDGDAAVAVAPAYQGRVMTSTFDVKSGPSFGWINRPAIERGLLSDKEENGKLEEHIDIFGGEERFWLGPEGGQYALFFKPGSKFEFSQWATPPAKDQEVEFDHTFDRPLPLRGEVALPHRGRVAFQKVRPRVGMVAGIRTKAGLDKDVLDGLSRDTMAKSPHGLDNLRVSPAGLFPNTNGRIGDALIGPRPAGLLLCLGLRPFCWPVLHRSDPATEGRVANDRD